MGKVEGVDCECGAGWERGAGWGREGGAGWGCEGGAWCEEEGMGGRTATPSPGRDMGVCP